MKGLLFVLPEASMDWASLPARSFLSERKSAGREKEKKGRCGCRGVAERARWGGGGRRDGNRRRNTSFNPPKTIPGGVHHGPHFTGIETQAGRGRPTCPRLQATKSRSRPGTM